MKITKSSRAQTVKYIVRVDYYFSNKKEAKAMMKTIGGRAQFIELESSGVDINNIKEETK